MQNASGGLGNATLTQFLHMQQCDFVFTDAGNCQPVQDVADELNVRIHEPGPLVFDSS
jgi:hypothetical protein